MATSETFPITEYLVFSSPFALTILLVFGMKYFSAIFQARARIANDAMYCGLAEKAVAIQSENQAALSDIRAELSRVAASIAAVEKILQQVD